MLADKDKQVDLNQADMFASQKRQIEQLNHEIQILSQDKAALRKQLDSGNATRADTTGRPSAQEYAETCKRLKKRELECQALWDTLKDMKQAGKNIFDTSEVLKVLARRALDTKAARKLDC